MNLFAALLLAHLIGDFPLQTNRIAQSKHESQWMLLIHVLVHVCVAAALIANPFQNVALLIMVGCSHYLIDLVKASDDSGSGSRCFLFDQVIHLASLSIITLIALYAPAALPSNALPTTILYPALAYAFLLGCMVFVWIWANEISLTANGNIRPVLWMRSRMLVLSQQAGVALLGAILIALFLP